MANQEIKKYKKKIIKSQERLYYAGLNKKIHYIRSNNAKEYWKLINKSTEGKQEYSKISLQAFLDHFKNNTFRERQHPRPAEIRKCKH